MKIYAIGDLHLPGGDEKPMSVFGAHWEGHFEKICADWRRQVTEGDVVLLPGDLSWAMQVEQALPDLNAVGALPGRKIILRGNHDYWWCGITRLREMLPAGMYALQNDAMLLDGVAFCGSRGWAIPDPGDAENEKIYARELIRLKMSLEQAARLGAARTVAMMHYPPLNERHGDTPVSQLLEAYGVSDVVYGHLHGPSLKGAFTGERKGIRYYCVSCDGLGFRLRQLAETSDKTGKVETKA